MQAYRCRSQHPQNELIHRKPPVSARSVSNPWSPHSSLQRHHCRNTEPQGRAATRWITAETSEIIRHRILIASRHGERIRTVDLTGLLVIQIAAQLQFQRVDVAEQLLTDVLDHRRIARKATNIQVLHVGAINCRI